MKEFFTLQSKLKKLALDWMLFFQKCVALEQSLLEKIWEINLVCKRNTTFASLLCVSSNTVESSHISTSTYSGYSNNSILIIGSHVDGSRVSHVVLSSNYVGLF